MRLISAIILVTVAFLIFPALKAQDSREDFMSVLTADSLAGRGYVENGQEKAATFIIDKLKEFQVQGAVNGKYRQTVNYPVNSIRGQVQLSLKSTKGKKIYLEEGSDFLIDASSPSIDLKNAKVNKITSLAELGELRRNKVYWIDADDFAKNELRQFLQKVKNLKSNTTALLIINNYGKLSWAPSYYQSSNAIVYLANDYSTISELTTSWEAKYFETYSSANIVGFIDSPKTDSAIVFTAHYDHLGKLGDAIFPGGNDNASGVSMLLSMAKQFSQTPPDYDVYFIFFTAEEIGLFGSRYFVQNPTFDLRRIKMLINLDLVGTGEEGIMVVNGVQEASFVNFLKEKKKQIPEIKVREMACNSDHCFFEQQGVPSVFIYTMGGKQAYHDTDDDGSGLSFFAYEELVKILSKYCRF